MNIWIYHVQSLEIRALERLVLDQTQIRCDSNPSQRATVSSSRCHSASAPQTEDAVGATKTPRFAACVFFKKCRENMTWENDRKCMKNKVMKTCFLKK